MDPMLIFKIQFSFLFLFSHFFICCCGSLLGCFMLIVKWLCWCDIYFVFVLFLNIFFSLRMDGPLFTLLLTMVLNKLRKFLLNMDPISIFQPTFSFSFFLFVVMVYSLLFRVDCEMVVLVYLILFLFFL